MTDPTAVPESEPTPTPAPAGVGPWRTIAIAAVLVAVAATAVAVFAFARDDDRPMMRAGDDRSLDEVRAACQDWFDAEGSPAGMSAGWCAHMGGWMGGQMGSGRMMGSMMWGSPEAMHDICTQAMADFEPASEDPDAWCDQMVDWMSTHMGDRWGWMMGGSATTGDS